MHFIDSSNRQCATVTSKENIFTWDKAIGGSFDSPELLECERARKERKREL